MVENATLECPASRAGQRAPAIAAAQHAIADIRALLHPRRKTGYGHKLHSLQPFVAQWLHAMSLFLQAYIQGPHGWVSSSLTIAELLGRGSYHSQQLRRWSFDFICDRSKLPDKQSILGGVSQLEDEDIALEVALHLQSLGKYVSALDLV